MEIVAIITIKSITIASLLTITATPNNKPPSGC